MRMWISFGLLSICFLYGVDSSGFGLVSRQSDCKIRCENGGMCAFSFEDESIHSCICLMGVYEGDRCQYQVGEDPAKIKAEERARQAEQRKIEEESRRREEERRLREEERANAERRRLHEKKIQEEEERRRVEKERSGSVATRPEDLERQREILRRQEEIKRREEERKRYDEERRRIMAEREKQENERIIEEKRRLEEEEQKIRQQQEEEIRKQASMKEPEIEDDLVDDDMEPDATGEEWNYEDETKQESMKEEDNEVKENEIVQKDDELTGASEEEAVAQEHDETSHSGDKNPFGALAKVIENAADMTLQQHSTIIKETEQENGDLHESEDDYWDHHPKKETEEYEVPKVMDSEEEDEIRRDQQNPQKDSSDVREFTTEEAEDGDGWMMVSRADSQESSAKSTALLSTLLVFIAYCRM